MVEAQPIKPEHQIYADLMNEARIRIKAVERCINDRDAWAPRLLQEFCYLQFRLLCETIALACMVAFGDVTGTNALKDWEPHRIIARLEELNPEFFPRGVRIRPHAAGIHLDEYPVPQLTKAELLKLWNRTGDFLHRGSTKNLLKEERAGPNVDLDVIIQWNNKILNLLDNHVISSADKKSHLCVGLLNDKGTSFVLVAQSP